MNAEQHTSEPVDQGSAEEMQAPQMKSGQENKSAQAPQEKGKRKSALTIFAAILIIAVVGGFLYWLHARHYEETDDAQIDGNLSPIRTRIDGTVIKVYVQNNQMVKVGDPLVDLDPCLTSRRSQPITTSQTSPPSFNFPHLLGESHLSTRD
jgi:membrane fusion protein (multidrug efflux system)